MGNEGLLVRELEIEGFEKFSQFAFDLNGLCFGTVESQKDIIGISDVVQTSEIGVQGVIGRQLSSFFLPVIVVINPTLKFGLPDFRGEVEIGRIGETPLSFSVLRNEHLFDIVVQFVEEGVA